MEVGEEGVDDLEFVGGIYEDIGVPSASKERAIAPKVLKDSKTEVLAISLMGVAAILHLIHLLVRWQLTMLLLLASGLV